jgi:hypothetical protein
MTEAYSDEELLYGEATDTILAELRAGRRPDPAAMARRYPTLANQFESHIAQLDAILRCGTAVETSATDLPQELGEFRIVREVGRGGMGVVYEAQQLSLRRRVALKVLPFATLLDPLRLQRFQQEAEAAAHLHHPHIVPVFAVGCERGLHYYAMQFVDGQSAAAVIQGLRHPPENPGPASRGEYPAGERSRSPTRLQTSEPERVRTVVRWGVQAAEALHYAHEVGVIHRDVKPANLLLDRRGDLWVADFGLARLRGGAELTETGDAVGTLRYMSPEQALGAKGVVDHRVDIYGLGATFYELLTLAPVLTGENREEMFHRLLEEAPVRPRLLNPAIPFDLETIVLKALRKEPAERYASAQELAEDLKRFQESKPILGRRPTLRDRTRAWTRRHALGLTATGGVLFVICAVLAASAAMIGRAYREAARKQAAAEHSRQLARRAIDQILYGEVADWLNNEAPPDPAQEKLLKQLLASCQELAQEDPADAEARFRVAEAWFRTGVIQHQLGRIKAALDSTGKALAFLAELTNEQSPSASYTFHRGQYLNMQARLLSESGNPTGAEKTLGEALADLEPLVEAHPDDPRYRYELGRAVDKLGALLQGDRARIREAEGLHGRAVKCFKDLSQAQPREPRYLYCLAHAYANQSTLFSRTNQLKQAEDAINESITIYRRLHERNRTARGYREMLAQSLALLADIRKDAKRPRQGEAPAREAVSLAADLERDYPNVPEFRRHHASNLINLANIVGLAGRPPDAEPLALQALAISTRLTEEFPGAVSYRELLADAETQLAMCYRNLRRLPEAERWNSKGITLLLQLLLDNPQNSHCSLLLQQMLPELRGLQTINRSYAKAIPCQQQVADALKRLLQQKPDERAWQEALGETYGFLGALHLRLRHVTEAQANYHFQGNVLETLAKASGAGQPEATYYLAWFLANCPLQGCRDPVRARTLAEQLLKTPAGNNPFTRVVLAAAHNSLKHFDEAAKLLEPIAQHAPDAATDVWINLAIAEQQLGKHADACRYLARAAKRVRTWSKPLDLDRLLLLAEVNKLLADPEPVLTLPPAAIPVSTTPITPTVHEKK